MKPGDKVSHRGLELHGTVLDAKALGHLLDSGWTVLVEFEDEETREVSLAQLTPVEEA